MSLFNRLPPLVVNCGWIHGRLFAPGSRPPTRVIGGLQLMHRHLVARIRCGFIDCELMTGRQRRDRDILPVDHSNATIALPNPNNGHAPPSHTYREQPRTPIRPDRITAAFDAPFDSARSHTPGHPPLSSWNHGSWWLLLLSRSPHRLSTIGDLLHHIGIGQGSDVPKLALFGDVTQQPPHDLPGASLG